VSSVFVFSLSGKKFVPSYPVSHTTVIDLCCIGVARGVNGAMPHKFLEHIVILYFERRFSKQNSVIRLKSNIWPPPFFWAGYATAVFYPFTLQE